MHEQQNSHYLHTPIHPHSSRTLTRSFHSYENGLHTSQIAIVNQNAIELYRIVGSSVVYSRTVRFMCDIGVCELVPAKGETSDVFFVGDELGRYFFWGVGFGVVAGNNLVKATEYLMPVYQRVPMEDKQPQFSGISSSFNSLETNATIFFTVSTKIIILKVRLSKDKIFFTSPPREIPCPYLDISYIGIVNGREPLIGFVQQREQKTFLRLHKASQHFECITSIEKTNLTRFHSSPEHEQIITVTNSQLSIYNLKTQQTFCTFQIPQSGYISSLDSELYVYVGQLGSQMIVFNKKHYKNYGAFMLENQVCLRLVGHGRLTDGGYLITVIDQGHTVEFIALYEDNWRSIRSIFSTSSIFSIEDLDRPNQTLAVVRVGQNMHQVGILSKHQTSTLHKETPLSPPILSLHSTKNGKSLLLSTPESNTVLLYSQQHKNFQQIFDFEPGSIVAVFDKFVVMHDRIYEMEIEDKCQIRELWVQRAGIVGAAFDGKFIGFQAGDFCFRFFNTGTREIDRVRKDCAEEYIWVFHSRETLLVGCLDQPGQLKIVPVFKQSTTVPLSTKQLITSITPHNDTILISYTNCSIQIYSYPSFNLQQTITSSIEPLQLISLGLGLGLGDRVLAYGTGQSYLIWFGEDGRAGWRQLEFDSSKENVGVVYLGFCEKFVVAHPRSLALYSLQQNKPELTSSFRVLSVNIEQNPPLVTAHENILYIVQNYELLTRNINTAELLKKQSHGLKEICCIEKLEIGLLVCGINDMDSVQIFVFGYRDLQILCAEALYKSQSYLKRMPTAIRRKGPNSFFLREASTISLYEISEQSFSFKEIFSTKTGLNGYTLSIQPQTSMVLASDPLRYLVVYDYRLDKLVSLCRYQSLNTINDAYFLDHSVVVGDSTGTISIAEFDLSKDDISRTLMTEVASLKTGSQIINISKGKHGIIYSTLSGSIGRITTLTAPIFTQLKQIELETLTLLESHKNEPKYLEWTNRNATADKLIDGSLIEMYIQMRGVSKEKRERAREIWKGVCAGFGGCDV